MNRPSYLPLQLDLDERPALVVGGGDVAAQKVSVLLRSGAVITVVSPQLCPKLAEEERKGSIEWWSRTFESGDASRFFITIAATGDHDVNSSIAREVEAAGRLVNVVDVPELCNFILPAVHHRGAMQVSVSTSGASPALASWMRDRIATELEDEPIEDLLDYIRGWRQRVRETIGDFSNRSIFWKRALSTGVPSLFLAGDRQRAEAELCGLLEGFARTR